MYTGLRLSLKAWRPEAWRNCKHCKETASKKKKKKATFQAVLCRNNLSVALLFDDHATGPTYEL